jgi:hypothetical protein
MQTQSVPVLWRLVPGAESNPRLRTMIQVRICRFEQGIRLLGLMAQLITCVIEGANYHVQSIVGALQVCCSRSDGRIACSHSMFRVRLRHSGHTASDIPQSLDFRACRELCLV